MLYYRFGEVQIYEDEPPGYDTDRGVEIGHKEFDLTHFEEAFTSKNWLVRIYKVLPQNNRAPGYEDIYPRRLFLVDVPEFEGEPWQFRGSP